MEIVKDKPETVDRTETKAMVEGPKKTPTYDPTKKYKWEHTDTFTISGTDFGAIMNSLGTFLSIYGPQVELAKKAYEGTQKALKNAVEFGIAVEIIENDKQE